MPPRWTVYLLECSDGSLYTGIALDVTRRVEQHNAGTGARYTRGRGPVRVVAQSRPLGRSAALRLEYHIKQLDRSAKPLALRDTHRGSRSAPRKRISG